MFAGATKLVTLPVSALRTMKVDEVEVAAVDMSPTVVTV